MPETLSKGGIGAKTRLGSNPARWRAGAQTAVPFLLVGALWEVTAHLGLFPPRLFPPLEDVAAALVRLTVAGILPRHAAETVLPLLAGLRLAAIVGVSLGIAMGRSRLAEDMLLPLVSIGAPIPGVAYAPLFLLWFGIGNISAILLVAFVSACSTPGRGCGPSTRSGCAPPAPWGPTDGAVLEGLAAGCCPIHHHRVAASLPTLLDRGRGSRDDHLLGLGTGVGDL
jgi:hypothetical protein